MPASSALKSRLHYFDLMKGVAIFMVVMGHVLTMCVRELDRAAVFKFIGQLHMPLFFFISGWFSCRVNKETDAMKMPSITQRATQLLLPMVIVSSLWVWYFPHSGLKSPLNSTFVGLWNDVWKNGYWFTLVLFEIIVCYGITVPILNKKRSIVGTLAIGTAVWILMWVLKLWIFPTSISQLLSWELVLAFYPAFFFGICARRFNVSFMTAIENNVCQTVAMISLAVTLYFVCWPWEFGASANMIALVSPVLHISLAVVVLNVFKRWSDSSYGQEGLRSPGPLTRAWSFLGTQSLAIYLLHYFFLFPMGWARDWLVETSLDLVPLAAFAIFWSALIILAVLGLIKLLQPSRTLSMLLIGSK